MCLWEYEGHVSHNENGGNVREKDGNLCRGSVGRGGSMHELVLLALTLLVLELLHHALPCVVDQPL